MTRLRCSKSRYQVRERAAELKPYLGVCELEPVRCGHHHHPVRGRDGAVGTQLDEAGQGHPRVRAVEHACDGNGGREAQKMVPPVLSITGVLFDTVRVLLYLAHNLTYAATSTACPIRH